MHLGCVGLLDCAWGMSHPSSCCWVLLVVVVGGCPHQRQQAAAAGAAAAREPVVHGRSTAAVLGGRETASALAHCAPDGVLLPPLMQLLPAVMLLLGQLCQRGCCHPQAVWAWGQSQLLLVLDLDLGSNHHPLQRRMMHPPRASRQTRTRLLQQQLLLLRSRQLEGRATPVRA